MPLKTTEQIVDEQTNRGVIWLDEYYPGWLDKIDLSDLKMSDCKRCIIGQAVMQFTETLFDSHAQACALGFDCGIDTNYFDLDAGWHRKIIELREERG